MQALEEILQEAKSAIQSASDLRALDHYRVHYLGKKGLLTEYLKTLGKLSAEERPVAGQKVNAVKEAIVSLIEERHDSLNQQQIEQQLALEKVDVTLAGRVPGNGTIHPIAHTFKELKRIFTQMGFIFLEGPEIEDDYHNFTALNIPPLHPARAMQDTFYFDNETVLRTHMSPVQIRAMKNLSLPFRMVAMGRVYRRDFDLTHTPMFHQMECMVVDENVTFADLKGLISSFLNEFFATNATIRFRPSYFPFTEPSAEVDMACLKCAGKGCRICKNTGWLEVLGCGMVHPNVLSNADINTERYRGFAFGLGVDRLTMLKYGISDLRSLFENDLRFLQQFKTV
jgi:phenylalanyl-tRNA synthetase alpha chain